MTLGIIEKSQDLFGDVRVMLNIERVTNLANKLKAKICKFNKDLLTKFPPDKYIGYLATYPQVGSYRHVSREVRDFCNDIIKYTNDETLELYHKLILVILIRRTQDKLENKKLPQDIKMLCSTNFEKILRNIEFNVNPYGFYQYQNDKFCKALAVCNLRMIPVGAQKIHLDGLPRRFLFKNGWRQLVKGIIFVSLELGGFKYFYQMHTDSNDPDLMADFNFKGWSLFYKRVAELLKKNDKIKGVFGSSWFFDPQLEKISPRLVYLRKIVTKNGANYFIWDSAPKPSKMPPLNLQLERNCIMKGNISQ